jgi:hypothetical protein
MYGGEQKCIQCCDWESWKDHWQDQGIDQKIILKSVLQKEYGVQHDKDQMWVLMNRVTNLWIPYNGRNSLTVWATINCQVAGCSMAIEDSCVTWTRRKWGRKSSCPISSHYTFFTKETKENHKLLSWHFHIEFVNQPW